MSHSWKAQGAWKEWSGRLAAAEEDAFERAILPLLRVRWPLLQQTERRKQWDQLGIDLFVWADEGPFPVVIQCKGFRNTTLGTDQVAQVASSVERFATSPRTTDLFILVHNRDGRDRSFTHSCETLLRNLQASGMASTALLWDRQQSLTAAFDAMQEVLLHAARRHTHTLRQRFRDLFVFGNAHVPTVPIAIEDVTFRSDAPITRSRQRRRDDDPRRYVQRSSGTDWTILTGVFGMGKSTATLRASDDTHVVLVVPAASIPEAVLRAGSTNALLQHVADELALLDHVLDADREPLRRMTGAVLAYLLRTRTSTLTFVIDGLDEHRSLAAMDGWQRLAHQIAEFRCPVVLTTRREHLDVMIGDVNAVFGRLAAKYGKQRRATLIDLQAWSLTETDALVSTAITLAPPAGKELLVSFQQAVADGRAAQQYGDLLTHPLFLHFILESVIDTGAAPVKRVQLLAAWSRRKIRRDRLSWAPQPASRRPSEKPPLDTDDLVERMVRVMEAIAFAMTDYIEGAWTLRESVPSAVVQEEFADLFGGRAEALLPGLLNSLITTRSMRVGSDVPVGFALRILHEFFLACYLVRHGVAIDDYPPSVRQFSQELLADPHTLSTLGR